MQFKSRKEQYDMIVRELRPEDEERIKSGNLTEADKENHKMKKAREVWLEIEKEQGVSSSATIFHHPV